MPTPAEGGLEEEAEPRQGAGSKAQLTGRARGYLVPGTWRLGRPSGACGTARAPRPAPSGTPGCRLREDGPLPQPLGKH